MSVFGVGGWWVTATDLCEIGSVVDADEFGLLRLQDCTTYATPSSYLTRLLHQNLFRETRHGGPPA